MPPPMLIDVLWRRLAAVLPPPPRLGRPCVHDRRLVLEAIVYVRESDCTSRMVATKTVPSRWCRSRVTYKNEMSLRKPTYKMCQKQP